LQPAALIKEVAQMAEVTTWGFLVQRPVVADDVPGYSSPFAVAPLAVHLPALKATLAEPEPRTLSVSIRESLGNGDVGRPVMWQ
jgi:hypothetical protein